MDYCYIEFNADNEDAIERLGSVIEHLKSDPSSGKNPEKELLSFFTDFELDTFWWPNQSQLDEIQTRWGDVPIRLSERKENEQEDWDVYSMFEVIAESEYSFLGLKNRGNSQYHLAFNPHAYPFGGTESLQKLVSSFGFSITAVDDGTGRTEKNNPKRENAPAHKKPWWHLW